MSKKQEFHDFCEAQIDRLGGAFPDFRFTKMGAIQELVVWLEDHAKGDKSRAVAFITSVTEFANMPTIAELNKHWYGMFPNKDTAAREAREECSRCNGTGWIEVAGPFGMSSAYPCSHQPESEADRRMGLHIAPSMIPHYAQEARESEVRKEAWSKNKHNPMRGGLVRVTNEQIAGLAR